MREFTPEGTINNRAADVYALDSILRDETQPGDEVWIGYGTDAVVCARRNAHKGMRAFTVKTRHGLENFPAGMPMVVAAVAICTYHQLRAEQLGLDPGEIVDGQLMLSEGEPEE